MRTLPDSSTQIYTLVMILAVVTIGSAFLHLIETPFLWLVPASAISLLVIDLIVSVRLLMAENVPQEVRRAYVQAFGSNISNVEFKFSKSSDYFTRIIFGRKLCYIPRQHQSSKSAEGAISVTDAYIISHELGHLVSGDAAHFHRTVLLLTLATASMMCIVVASFFYFPISIGDSLQTLFGVALFILFAVSVLSYALHLREFKADRTAMQILSKNPLREMIERMAKIERHIKFPILYRITHPSFAKRLAVINDHCQIFQLSVFKAAFFGVLLGATSVLLNFAADAISNRQNDFVPSIFSWVIVLR